MKTHSWPDNHWGWPIELSHYHGVRRGGFIYTGGQADLDEMGCVVNPDDLSLQTHNVLRYVESVLVDLGSSLHDLIKLVIYFTGDESDESMILDLIATCLSSETRPVVSTICLPELCYPGMRIELEAVAIDPELRSDVNPDYVRISELAPLPESYSHVVRCNELIFTGDISAITPDGQLPAHGDVVAQTRLMMRNLEHALAQLGTTTENALKISAFYLGDGTAQSWSEPAAIRAAFFSEPGPAATGIPVIGFARAGLMTKIAVTAACPAVEPGKRSNAVRYSWPEGHWNWTSDLPYKHGNRFGKILHLGGQVALDANAKVLHPDDIVEQTTIALNNIETILADLGAGMNDIVKVTTFYKGNASAEGLHENLLVRSSAFKPPGPATSGIPVPHLVYEKMMIEIDVIAVAN